jgi:hypothetical protein
MVASMAFESHTDASELLDTTPVGLQAYGLWMFGGSWMSTHGKTGVITDEAVAELDGKPDQVAKLVDAGMWTRVDGGYRYERGPSADWPLPIWRFSDEPGTGLITILPEPDA